MTQWLTTHRTIGLRLAALSAVAACLVLASPAFHAQGLDICGCASVPNLQPFDSQHPATFPPGTSDQGIDGNITIPLPPDGILKFSSFNMLRRHVSFFRNAANSPVMILVAGDVNITSPFCCYNFRVSGNDGSNGSSQLAGIGGLGG